MPRSITATRARQDFFRLIESAERAGHHVVITMEGQPRVVMLSIEEYEGWLETLEIMDDPRLLKQIQQGVRTRSKGKTPDEVRSLLSA